MTALRKLTSFNERPDARTRERGQGGRIDMPKSNALRGTELVPKTESVPKMTENAAAAGISAVILPFTSGQLAKVAGRSKDTAKSWLEGARCPHLASVINLARALPSVWAWLAEECGHADDARAGSLDAVLRWATQARTANGQEGDIARAILRAAAEPPEIERKPPAPSIQAELDLERRRA